MVVSRNHGLVIMVSVMVTIAIIVVLGNSVAFAVVIKGHAKVTCTVNIAINVIWYPNCILLPS